MLYSLQTEIMCFELCFACLNVLSNLSLLPSSAAAQSNVVMQPAPVTNPFGTLPAMPQMSIGRVGSAPSVQYGISSMPVRSIYFYNNLRYFNQ